MRVIIFRYIVGMNFDSVNGDLVGWEDEKIEKAIELCHLGTKLETMVKQYDKYDHKIRKYTHLKDALNTVIKDTKKRMRELGWKDVFESEEVKS